MLTIGIAANLESRGLTRDAQVLKQAIESFGYKAFVFQDTDSFEEPVDVLIHCERISWTNVKRVGVAHWLLVNPEFIREEDRPWIERYFSRLLCKTVTAERICKEIFPSIRVKWISFTSEDRYFPGIEKKNAYLHVCGNSRFKGTEAVVDAWRWKLNGERYAKWPLIVVSDWFPDDHLPEGVIVLRELSDESLKYLQNECRVHIQPSETEGWGHTLWECLSTGNLLVTTDAEPMNEIPETLRVPTFSEYKLRYATCHKISAIELGKKLKELETVSTELIVSNFMSRPRFKDNHFLFRAKLYSCFQEIEKVTAAKTKGALRIGFIGNFNSPYSTESHILWAMKRLGHTVCEMQENEARPLQVAQFCAGFDVLFWVKTPNFMVMDPQLVIDAAKKHGVPTVAMHLDRFWGIPKREEEIGVHPFWRCDWVFTADGGNQQKFRDRGVNHAWLRPAVSEVYIHPGTRLDVYAQDVCFVGAESYHSEYPFRKIMVTGLRERYGDHFLHIEGIRGHELNDVYASAKVIVGDCIFAGEPFYYSDRVPETFGREGFMVHPNAIGYDYPSYQYEAQNLDSLFRTIDQALALSKQTRDLIAARCALHCAGVDTWTIRILEILNAVRP